MSNHFIDPLEPRRLFATYGNPWPDGSRLTLSFAPDTTPLVSLRSQLNSLLDSALPRSQWQAQIARALQTWAVHTDLNIGYRPDGGQKFGVSGFALGDPRFGDIRIGAHEMTTDVLAVSVPYDPARAGTLTGDIFLNSSFRFDAQPYDLTTVMLHVAGHVFGLDHSTDPLSPMFERFNNTTSQLTPGDIAAIRALYGNRPADRFDSAGTNDSFADATPIPTPNNFDGSTPLAVFGDLTHSSDIDFYKFQTPSDDNGYSGRVTVRLQSAGISLLRPSLRLLDSSGNPLAFTASTSSLGDTLTLSFQTAGDDTDFYLQVASAATDVFAVGTYAAAVIFDARNTTPAAVLDTVLTGPHALADADTLRQLFLSNGQLLLNPDASTNNTPDTATDITPPWQQPLFRGPELLGSIESPTDVDHYRIELPPSASTTLTFNLWSQSNFSLLPALTLLSPGGDPLPARILANGNRTVTLQLDPEHAGSEVIVRVSGRSTGNYFFSLDRVTPRSSLSIFATGTTLNAGVPRVDTLYVAESQLMHFLLTAEPHPDPAVRLTMQIVDFLTGRLVYQLEAKPGETVSGPSALLATGEYRVRFVAWRGQSPQSKRGLPAVSEKLAQTPILRFTLQGASLSGPIGPSIRDPLLLPRYLHPTFQDARLYPNGRVTKDRFLWDQAVV